MQLLPKWVLLNTYPAVYDFESLTATEQTARVYGAMQTLIEEYNKFADSVNTALGTFTESETEARAEFETNVTKVYRQFVCQMEDYLRINLDSTAERVFVEGMNNGTIKVPTDITLKKSNSPADAAATGQMITKKAAALANEIAVERARINNLANLPEGSTSGDAELADIRTGFDGTVYDSAGEAVRSQVEFLKGHHDDQNKMLSGLDFYTPHYTVLADTRISNGGVEVTGATGYTATDYIEVAPGQAVRITATASENYTAPLAAFSKTKAFIKTVFGSGTHENAVWMNNTDEAVYIRGCSSAALSVELMTVAGNVYALRNHFTKPDGTEVIASTAPENYVQTTPIKLNKGDTVFLYGEGSGNICTIAEVNKNGVFVKCIYPGANALVQFKYTASKDEYVCLGFNTGSNYAFRIQKAAEVKKQKLNSNRRLGTINFQFDDGAEEDADIAAVFDAYNLKCSFAILSTVSMADQAVYLGFQERGFEILSHSTDGGTMNDPEIDPETLKTKMLTAKTILENKGFNIRGWVTPSSQMADVFKPLVKKYYDYGFTNYYGPYYADSAEKEPYSTIEKSPYELFRVDLSSGLENIKTAVDRCIENSGFLTFYYHGADMNESMYSNLEGILAYITEKSTAEECVCLPASAAFDYYYHVRHEDIYGG